MSDKPAVAPRETQTETRVANWVRRVLGEHCMQPKARGLRFLEESMELSQACGVTREEAQKTVEMVFAKPIGQVRQEIGGCGTTLAGVASAYGLSVQEETERELSRIESLPAKKFQDRENENAARGIGFVPAAPAESQGVERAQPVEGPREQVLAVYPDAFAKHECGVVQGIPYSYWEIWVTPKDKWSSKTAGSGVTESLAWKNASYRLPAAPVEGVERVTCENCAGEGWIDFEHPCPRCSTTGRVERLRERIGRAEAALREIANEDSDCGCDCATSDCCVKVGVFCPLCIARAALAAPVEGVERVTDDAPARVEPVHDGSNHHYAENYGLSVGVPATQPIAGPREPTCKLCGEVEASHPVLEEERECLQFKPWPAAQPAKHTDDRPAETIPGKWQYRVTVDASYLNGLFERNAKAETRIEVLEAALRYVQEHNRPEKVNGMWLIDAALAAPSGETPHG